MRDEITRIMRLVQEGKLSPEDGAELIDALQASPDEPPKAPTQEAANEAKAEGTTPPPPPNATSNPFAGFLDAVEKVAKDVASNVDWNEVSTQVRKGVHQGTEAVKKVAKDIKDGKINFGFDEASSKQYEHPLVITESQTLRIEIPKGDIKVDCTKGEGKIVAHMTFHADSKEAAEKAAAEFTLMIEESEHFVLLKLPEFRNMSGVFEVSVPHGVAVDIRTEAGDVSVNGAIGNSKVSVTSGDVVIENSKGSLELGLTSGDLTMKNSDFSSLSVSNKSGDLRLESVTGIINLRSSSGDVVISEAGGKSLSVETISGDLTITYANGMKGNASLRTVNGEISVALPEDADCRIKLSAIQGEVTSKLVLQDEARAKGSLTGRLGEGFGSLDVSTVNGDINLSPVLISTTIP
jgi:DUF4097 and DUF4098 domain-containing protein YvlB